jgi:hypothetical protein
LKELTKEMDADGPFFFGPSPSLIDFVVAPWIVSAATVHTLVVWLTDTV